MKKDIIYGLLIFAAIIAGMIILHSILPVVFFIISLLGWVLVFGIIFSLTGLQSKLLKGIGKSIYYNKKIKIPFIGSVEITSESGKSLILKITK